MASEELATLLDLIGSPNAETVALMQALLQAAGGVLLVKGVQSGRYVFGSEGAAQLFDRPLEQLLGASDAELMSPDEANAMRKAEQAVLAQRSQVLSEHKLEREGRKREFTVTRLPLGAGHLGAVWVNRTQERLQDALLKRALEQLEQQQAANEQMRRELQLGSGRDATTGLYLRAQFEDQLRREVDLSTREHREFALVLIALDPPSAAAAALGETAHLSLLEGLGRLLRNNTRAMDASCRVGDEHFAVLLSGVGLATAHARMEQLRRQCASQIVVLQGQDLGMSVSMGVASFPHTASSQEELMQASELALQDAQRRGGNHVALATIRFEPV
ncbi:MAG: diguanylate cyclase [Burkholderiaceae bacterium]|nr:diguanylate cyclase [Burkholderiaceae bacterium]